MPKLRSPITWFGGKGSMTKKIIPIPESINHSRYIEPFGGGASILISKKRVANETYNDIDEALYDFFTLLTDDNELEKFIRIVSMLPVSRQLYNEYIDTWRNEIDKVKRVAKWFLINRQSFSGRFGSGIGMAVNINSRNLPKSVSGWLSSVDMLPEIHTRLQYVQIENKFWKNLVRQHDHENALFYCDPPYLKSTRKSGLYQYEMTVKDHIDMLSVLSGLKGKVALSGYDSELYRNHLSDDNWYKTSWSTVSHAAGSTRNTQILGKGAKDNDKHRRTECLWINHNAYTTIDDEKIISIFE